QINPDEIGYVEVHGTGTKLGDPVEANALVRAFQKHTSKQGYCSVGSAKSHIGHTSAAAGVIGLIKVLLSMQHRQIPALLHFKELNSLIEFKESPFFINTQLSQWESKENSPRMAALSSFGHSGTNVHLVIKEYIPSQFIQTTVGLNKNKLSTLFTFSAKTEESLKSSIEEFLLFLNEQETIKLDKKIILEEIAYTLQTGREPMRYRTVFLAENISELKKKLDSFLKEEKDIRDCWKGKGEPQQISLLSSDEDAQEMLIRWVEKGKLKKIGELWCQGLPIEWDLFYGDNRPGRIHLPTYSFTKERFGISGTEGKWPIPKSETTVPVIHSLLHENTTLEKKTTTRLEFLKSEEPAENSHLSSLSPEDKIQKFLQQVVGEQLNESGYQIQVDQSFSEIGIGSLGIVNVVKQLEALLDVELSPIVLFQYINIQELSAYVSQQFADRVDSIIMVPQRVEIQQIKESSSEDALPAHNYKLLTPYKQKKRRVELGKTNEIQKGESVNLVKRHTLEFPLSEGEKGLWMLQTENPSMSAYNVPICYQISGNINLEYLGKAWGFVLEQYPILKARILEKEGIPYHCITEECKTTIGKEHIAIDDNKELLSFLKDQVRLPFHLDQGPLTRIQVFTRDSEDPILLITIHHIVSDGISIVLLMECLLKTYRQFSEGTAPSQNRDITSYEEFALWEQTMLESLEGARHADYWKEQLRGELQ
ncbi:MAG: hypothetical protein GY781_04350, partial [Gammaproteobacteria bacterium]|nr:hypothetical protein [Gammaproteobacteria bacterium]